MIYFDLRQTDLSVSKAGKITQSKGKQTRLSEAVFLRNEGIGAHIHTEGEDCALVLTGELTYFISNNERIKVQPGELVCGWKRMVHGYLNERSDPLQLLLFVTPGSTGLAYPNDQDPIVIHLPVHERRLNCRDDGAEIGSEYASFKTMTIHGKYWEEKEEGTYKAFVDWRSREVYVFDNEEVLLCFPEERRLLKYTARS